MKTNKINNETRVPNYEKYATTVPRGFKAFIKAKAIKEGVKMNVLTDEALRQSFPDFKG